MTEWRLRLSWVTECCLRFPWVTEWCLRLSWTTESRPRLSWVTECRCQHRICTDVWLLHWSTSFISFVKFSTQPGNYADKSLDFYITSYTWTSTSETATTWSDLRKPTPKWWTSDWRSSRRPQQTETMKRRRNERRELMCHAVNADVTVVITDAIADEAAWKLLWTLKCVCNPEIYNNVFHCASICEIRCAIF